MASATGGRVERMEVEPRRFNVLARWGNPVVTLSNAHGHGAAVFRLARGRRIHLGARGMRYQGHIAACCTRRKGCWAKGQHFALLSVVAIAQ